MAGRPPLLAPASAGAAALKARKSPRQSRSTALVEAILEAAARILESDPAAFTTNHVAERAGVSIGSLYQYFPNKAALVAALIARSQAEIAAAVNAAVAAAANAPLDTAVAALVDAGIAYQLDQPARAAAIDAAERELPVAPLLDATRAEITRATALLLHRHGIADADSVATDLAIIARALIDSLAAAGTPRAELRRRVLRAVTGYLAAR